MQATIPSADEVRAALGSLSMAQVHELSRLSGVPWTTLRKIRDGETPNPRIETVRQFAPHVSSVGTPASAAPAASAA